MEQIFKDKLNQLGYNQLVCDIFPKWEDVKDEILVPERKTGTGNGTIHVFLGAADNDLKKEFSSYYQAVNNGEDPSIGAVEVKHYFLVSNVLSMLGYVCQYYYSKGQSSNDQVRAILNLLSSYKSENGLLETISYFKLSTGSSKLRPYFKQFDGNGVFTKLIRQLLLPNSGYKISLYKNPNGEYAAFWLIGFDWQTDFEANSNKSLISDHKRFEGRTNSLQQIFYGAPGTGKSHCIKDNDAVKEADKKNLVFRTTFHPDSDYSTFVGAYKPTSIEVPVMTIIGKEQMPVVNAQPEKKIIYSFVPQAFLQSYVAAWNNPDDKVFLVIEEINRGNCAQIFGDLFQLLDRDENGWSEYPIMADKDLAKYLNGNDESNQPVLTNKDGIKDGKLCLPKNLHIWATMNTSDQSLFPIDSAFKRRWDWVYMPIEDAGKNWTIEVNGHDYDWYRFLTAINKEVFDLTHSEDKQLGYFFAKAKDGKIDAATLVNKVYFYLWTDVFKDYDFESQKAFKKADGNEAIAFKEFFLRGNVNEPMAEQVLINLGLNKPNEPTE